MARQTVRVQRRERSLTGIHRSVSKPAEGIIKSSSKATEIHTFGHVLICETNLTKPTQSYRNHANDSDHRLLLGAIKSQKIITRVK